MTEDRVTAAAVQLFVQKPPERKMSLFSLFPLAVYGQAAASALSQPAIAVLHLLRAAAELLNGDNGSHNLLRSRALHDSDSGPCWHSCLRQRGFPSGLAVVLLVFPDWGYLVLQSFGVNSGSSPWDGCLPAMQGRCLAVRVQPIKPSAFPDPAKITASLVTEQQWGDRLPTYENCKENCCL